MHGSTRLDRGVRSNLISTNMTEISLVNSPSRTVGGNGSVKSSLQATISNLVYAINDDLHLFTCIYMYLHLLSSCIYFLYLITFSCICICIYLQLLTCIYCDLHLFSCIYISISLYTYMRCQGNLAVGRRSRDLFANNPQEICQILMDLKIQPRSLSEQDGLKLLVGGLEHQFYFPINIGLLIIPIDELIFFRGVAEPPSRSNYPGSFLFGEFLRLLEALVIPNDW